MNVPAERRVLRRLAELADVYADDDGVVALTQKELGQIAGTTRPTVNRVLREQEERGTIALKRGQTKIVDRESLLPPGSHGRSRRGPRSGLAGVGCLEIEWGSSRAQAWRVWAAPPITLSL